VLLLLHGLRKATSLLLLLQPEEGDQPAAAAPASARGTRSAVQLLLQGAAAVAAIPRC